MNNFFFGLQVIADGFAETPEGLIYREFADGIGDMPTDGQEVILLMNHSGMKPESLNTQRASFTGLLGSMPTDGQEVMLFTAFGN